MTESEWLACDDPHLMLHFLSGRADSRKLRLFICACCRRDWHRLTEPRSRRAVEVAERYADCWASERELRVAREEAWVAYSEREAAVLAGHGSSEDLMTAWEAGVATARRVFHPTLAVAAGIGREMWPCVLLRDIVNPFRHAAVDRSWLRWDNGTVARVARRVYDERRFDDLPILADALEEAGCTDTDILAHCRGPGPHVRGCWMVDLLLGKS
jgi:hypothetical protein